MTLYGVWLVSILYSWGASSLFRAHLPVRVLSYAFLHPCQGPVLLSRRSLDSSLFPLLYEERLHRPKAS